MKVSLDSLKVQAQKYGTSSDPYSYGIDDIIRRIGHQLGAVEEVIRTGGKYDGVLVAKVVACEKHPDADKLSLCMIDDGGVTADVERDENGNVQVVCGAPNVREGITVAWLPPGSTVPSTRGHDPFVLGVRELRGKVSNGMIASAKELGISDEHEGILEIDPQEVGEDLMAPGTEFKKLYGLDDVIIDCENKMFTHRPDCFGAMGVGREIAGIFGDKYTSPQWYANPVMPEVETDLPLSTPEELIDLVPRFSAIAMSDVEVKPSPMWLQSFLSRMGQKSINNIVDYTNYFMMISGQPLHAFDYDKVKSLCDGDSVVISPRMANKGETLKLLNGKTIELTEGDIVIATDSRPIALGGVMGGSETEVDGHTKNIIIEGANFDMYNIRRTSMRHGLFTDAVARFNKGQSPLQNIAVIIKMVDEVKNNAGGKVASELLDKANFDVNADNLNRVSVTVDFINKRLGSSLGASDIKTLLENVEFMVEVENDSLSITAPFWRMDIAIGEDIVEEVGRLHGYANLPVELPPRNSKPAPKNSAREFKQELRDKLSRAGATEVLTYSFVHGDLMRKTGTDPDKWAFHLRNALSPDLQYYRTSLMPSLLAKVHKNIREGAGSDDNEFVIYEIGKAHVKEHNEGENNDGLPVEMNRLALVFVADDRTAGKYHGAPYYQAKKYLDYITDGQAVYSPLDTTEFPITGAYNKKRSATVKVNGQIFAVLGEFSAKTTNSLKLPKYTAGFELTLELLEDERSAGKYEPMSNYPSTSQDITLEVPSDTAWGRVYDFIRAEVAVGSAEDDLVYEVVPLDIFQPEDDSLRRMSFRTKFASRRKTMKTEEISRILQHIETQAKETLNARRI